MSVIRLLLLMALIYLAYRLLRYFISPSLPPASPSQEGEVGPTLVRCLGCGVWIPQEKALHRGDQIWCSEKCAPKKE
jgi:uncharacterized protein